MPSYQNIGNQNYDLGSTLVDGFWNSQVFNDWFIGQWLFWLGLFVLAIFLGWLLSKSRHLSVGREMFHE
jgi:hypothetical protein